MPTILLFYSCFIAITMDITIQLKAAANAAGQFKQVQSLIRSDILMSLSKELEIHAGDIARENAKDLALLSATDPTRDRLLLNEERVMALAKSVVGIAGLEDPSGKLLSSTVHEGDLLIEKRTEPMGVVGVIYESRPNVTIDVAALCIRSANVGILRGGSDAWNTNFMLVKLVRSVLADHSLNPDIIQLLPADRKFVIDFLSADKYIDIIIPRGSQGLIDFVRSNAKVPVIETGAGVCHTYVEQSAKIENAIAIVENAKLSRPSVCNALDTIILDAVVAETFLHKLSIPFQQAGVELFADEISFDILKSAEYPCLVPARPEDFGREFLSLKCSVKVVNGIGEALEHIATYSSGHSECIISESTEKIEQFLNAVDAAAVYANASTRFTDGAMFGLGAEIGISTQKLHARGPFALEKLVTEKWIVRGSGQIRK